MRLDERIVAIVGPRSDIARVCSERLQEEGATILMVDDSDAALSSPIAPAGVDHFVADVEEVVPLSV